MVLITLQFRNKISKIKVLECYVIQKGIYCYKVIKNKIYM